MSEVNLANHILESILKDLSFLKDNNFLPNQTYSDVVAMLPSRISNHNNALDTSKPPLPTRKSTSSTTNSIPPPAIQPREMPSFPKLPVRRTSDWQSPQPTLPSQQHHHHHHQQQQQHQQYQAPQPLASVTTPSITKNILHSEPEKSAPPPPPAYTQKPAVEPPSLATAEALYDYHGEDPTTDLSFKQGDIIEVTEYVNDDWWKGTANGKSGIFPQNHVKKIAPPIKAKRPWMPPAASKPSFSANSNTLNTVVPPPSTTINNTTTMPYSYPPPPTAMYTPPPAQSHVQSYAQPSSAHNNEQQNGEEGGDKKVHNMAKRFGDVATAATWGFGATLGSQAARAIF